MVFTTQRLINRASRSLGLLLCALALLTLSGPLRADSFEITRVNSMLSEGVYLLDADVDLVFSQEAIEALDSGVPLTLIYRFDVDRKRTWWLDEDIATLEQQYQLVFHALTHRYLVVNLNSGALRTFPNLTIALYKLGTVRDFPLLDIELIEEGSLYEVEMQVELDIEALPAPLRPVAYLTPGWRLKSDWYAWLLQP